MGCRETCTCIHREVEEPGWGEDEQYWRRRDTPKSGFLDSQISGKELNQRHISKVTYERRDRSYLCNYQQQWPTWFCERITNVLPGLGRYQGGWGALSLKLHPIMEIPPLNACVLSIVQRLLSSSLFAIRNDTKLSRLFFQHSTAYVNIPSPSPHKNIYWSSSVLTTLKSLCNWQCYFL